MQLKPTLSMLSLFLLLIVYLFVGGQVFWADSEMWSVTSAFHLFGKFGHDHSLKPLFDFIIYLFTRFGFFFGLNIMDSARYLFSFVMILNLAFFYRLAIRLKFTQHVVLISLFVFMATSLFWERSFRVRSDYLVLLCHLLALNFWAIEKKDSKNMVYLLLSLLAAYFISPKSILVSSVIVLLSLPHFINIKTIQLKGYIWAFVSFIFLTLLLIKTNPSASSYFFNSFLGSEKGIGYFSIKRFEHLYSLLVKNIWLVPILLLSIKSCIVRFKQNNFYKFVFSLFCLIAIYPNKLPFFICSLLLFFILPGVDALLKLSSKTGKHQAIYRCCIVSLFILSILKSQKMYFKHRNDVQRVVQNQLCDELLNYPKARVLDPIGLCPHRLNSYYYFLGPYHNNKNELDKVIQVKPDVVLEVAKLQYLYPGLNEMLKKSYKYNPSGLFYKFETIENKNGILTQQELQNKVKLRFNDFDKKPSVNYKFTDDRGQALVSKKQAAFNAASFVEIIPFDLSQLQLESSLNSLFRYDSEL